MRECLGETAFGTVVLVNLSNHAATTLDARRAKSRSRQPNKETFRRGFRHRHVNATGSTTQTESLYSLIKNQLLNAYRRVKSLFAWGNDSKKFLKWIVLRKNGILKPAACQPPTLSIPTIPIN